VHLALRGKGHCAVRNARVPTSPPVPGLCLGLSDFEIGKRYKSLITKSAVAPRGCLRPFVMGRFICRGADRGLRTNRATFAGSRFRGRQQSRENP
jgi:hypothetical protein